MFNLDDDYIKDFICNETASFALSIIDLDNEKVIYTNKAMNNILYKKNAKKCFKKIYGQESKCPWCKANNFQNQDIDANLSTFEHEYFNEITNKWYQTQNKITFLADGRKVLILIAIDISTQKKSQSDLIITQVKLLRQTQELKKAQEELKLLALTDPLTKLYNRRYFTQMSESCLELAKRNNTNASILMIDIDNFKSINDTYGHKIGDDVIVIISSLLQKQNRKSDIVCRWGGEEFIILLSNTNTNGAIIIAQKIRNLVENSVITLDNNDQIKFTISIGISEIYTQYDKDIEDSINRADKALYKAKDSGKNRVEIEK